MMKSILFVALIAMVAVAIVHANEVDSLVEVQEFVAQLPSATPTTVATTPRPRPRVRMAPPAANCIKNGVNDCTMESANWGESTEVAMNMLIPVLPAPDVAVAAPAVGPAGIPPAVVLTATDAAVSVEGEAFASATATCPGTCQEPTVRCANTYLSGLCPGRTAKCCPSSATAAAPTSLTALTGRSTRIKDTSELYAGGRTATWSDFTLAQQTNIRLLIKYAKQQKITDPNQIAYILGTAEHECHLTPISEWGGKHTRYAPYYGRGFVQLTWRENYDVMSKLLMREAGITVDLVRNPEQALNPEYAAFIATYGMKHGSFTTKSLSDYFPAGKKPDFVGARRIINGVDKAQTIASISKAFIPLVRVLLTQ